MINFYNGFINTEYAKPGSAGAAKPANAATMEMLIQHFEHVIKVAGIDHVGIGSDFDGVDGMPPGGMEDVSKLPAITYELLKRGYSDADVKKVLGGNLLRVMAEVEEAARKSRGLGRKSRHSRRSTLRRSRRKKQNSGARRQVSEENGEPDA